MQTQTLLDAYRRFSATEVCQSSRRLLDNLRTTLRRYVLPEYGFSSNRLRSDFEGCLAQISLSQFLEDTAQLLEIFNNPSRNPSAQKVSAVTLSNYRSTLLRFLNWLYSQDSKSIPALSNDIGKVIPPIHSGQTLSKARRGGRNLNTQPYALKDEEINSQLQEQLKQLKDFLTKPETERKRISDITFESYQNSILCVLGWQKNIQNELLECSTLERLADPDTLKTFIEWGMEERKNSYGWAINIIQAALSVTKWLSTHSSASNLKGVQRELRSYLQTLRKHRQTFTTHTDTDSLTLNESVEVVNYLKQCCAPLHSSGVPRSESAVIKSWQRYLIVALLVYTPLRQREIRELKWDDSLIRESAGYRVQFNTYRTIPLLPKQLTLDLDRWRNEFRSKITSDTNLVFTRLGSGRTPESSGKPLNSRDISDLISAAVYKATSVLFDIPKRGTPHSFQQVQVLLIAEGIQSGHPLKDVEPFSTLKSVPSAEVLELPQLLTPSFSHSKSLQETESCEQVTSIEKTGTEMRS